ncbi:hypothetical protein BM51_0948 [Streptococcus pneumoniae]|nr:hypothetical protein BM51_0948 [Streptococcus pneumoniae]
MDYHLDKFKEPIQYLVKQQLNCKRNDHPKEFHNPNNRFDKKNSKKTKKISFSLLWLNEPPSRIH